MPTAARDADACAHPPARRVRLHAFYARWFIALWCFFAGGVTVGGLVHLLPATARRGRTALNP